MEGRKNLESDSLKKKRLVKGLEIVNLCMFVFGDLILDLECS